MGWTFRHLSPVNVKTIKEEILSELNCDNENGKWEVIDYSKRGNTVYTATRRTKPDGTTYVFATVVLIKSYNEYHNFGTKLIDESMGPYEYDCPLRILNKLTPLIEKEGFSEKWRNECRKQHAENAKNKQKRLKEGDLVRFNKPICFGKVTKQVLRYSPKVGRGVFSDSFGNYFRVRNYKQRGYVVAETS